MSSGDYVVVAIDTKLKSCSSSADIGPDHGYVVGAFLNTRFDCFGIFQTSAPVSYRNDGARETEGAVYFLQAAVTPAFPAALYLDLLGVVKVEAFELNLF